MLFNKPPLSLDDQIKSLKKKNLTINDETIAKAYLANISYYRLRAYTYPFQDNNDPNHPFNTEISFEEIIDIYVFDRRLRMYIFNAIEKIEIAIRTRITYHYSMEYGSHWYEDLTNFNDNDIFTKNLRKLKDELNRSSENFIKHYKRKYKNPKNPPAWMSLEVISIGLLSKIYDNLKITNEKRIVADELGLPNFIFLENWLRCITNLRNMCAHHSRVWNRKFTSIPKLPKKAKYKFLNDDNYPKNKLYIQLSLIIYFLNIISPDSDFVKNIKNLISDFKNINTQDMGFPENWEDEEIWK